MIKLLRIDDRLIHGQVAVYWVNATGADTIVIANDKHATNAMLKMSLTVGKPAGSKMEVLTVAKAVDYLNNAANAKRKILLICGSCEDAETLCAGAAEIKEVDLGGIRFAEGRTSISNQVFLVEDDLRHLDAIAGQGRTVYIQEAPSKPKIPLSEIHSIFEKNKKYKHSERGKIMFLIQCILVSMVHVLSILDGRILGQNLLNTPIVEATLVGLICGDVQTGLVMGAT